MYCRVIARTGRAFPPARIRIHTGPILNRGFSASPRAYTPKSPQEATWTDKIRSAIISLLPEDHQIEIMRQLKEEGQKPRPGISSLVDPTSPKSQSQNLNLNLGSPTHTALDTLHRQLNPELKEFDNLITRRLSQGPLTDKEISIILHDYSLLKGRLEENSVVILAVILYNNGMCKRACKVLLENLNLGVNLFTGFCDKFIPQLCEYHGKEFVLGNVVEAFVSIGHTNTVDQLLAELGEDEQSRACQIADAEMVLQIKEKALDKFVTNDMLVTYIHDSYDLWVPQVFGKDHINIWTRLQIFNIFVSRDPIKYTELAFKKFSRRFWNQKFLLRNFIWSTTQQQLREADSVSIWDSSFTDKFGRLLKVWYIPFHPDDVQAIAYISSSPRIFTKTLKAFIRYYKERCQKDPFSAETNEAILNTFLRRAISFGQSYDVKDTVKLGACNDPVLVGRAINTVLWGKKRTEEVDDSALVVKPSDGTGCLLSILNNVPGRVLTHALSYSMKSLGKKPPGRLIWDFLLAIESCPNITELPVEFEKNATIVMASRPHFEQMRYMALSKVSTKAIMVTLRNFIMSIDNKYDKTDVYDSDSKLILAGLILIKEKSAVALQEPKDSEKSESEAENKTTALTMAPNSDAYLGRVITDLFLRWDESKAVGIVEFLSQREIQPPEDAIIKSVGLLAYRGQFVLALKLMDSVPEIPPKALFDFLIKASKNYPNICTGLLKWMREEKNMYVPASVLRLIIQGYCKSPLLTSAQCNNRVNALIGDLRAQNRAIGDCTAVAIVERILKDIQETGRGSKHRLSWAMDLAKQEKVSDGIIDGWSRRLESMRVHKEGFWSSTYTRRMKALTLMSRKRSEAAGGIQDTL